MQKHLKLNKSQVTYVVLPLLVAWELLRSLLFCSLSTSELPLIKQTYWAFLHVSTISFFIRTDHLLQLLLNKVHFSSMFTLVVGKSTKIQFKRKNRLIWLRIFRYCFQEKSETENLCVFVLLVRYKLSSTTKIFWSIWKHFWTTPSENL